MNEAFDLVATIQTLRSDHLIAIPYSLIAPKSYGLFPDSLKQYAFEMLVYLNGQYLPAREARVSALDRGLIFGDGVYEVWRVVGGQMFEAARHQARLERGLGELRIARPADGTLERLTAIGERLQAENGLVGGDATL